MQRELKELGREVKELAEKAKQVKEAKKKLTELDSNLQNKDDLSGLESFSKLANINPFQKVLSKLLKESVNKGTSSVVAVKSLCLLSGGFSITDTANELGVSRQTIYNWLQNNDFKKLLSECKEIIFQSSIAQIKEMNYKAVNTLAFLLNRPQRDTEKLKVVKYIIDTNLKLMSEEKLKMEYSKKEKTESKTEELSLMKEQKKKI